MKFISFFKFIRPHAFAGTVFQFFIVYLLVQPTIDTSHLFLGFVSLVFCHIYGMGFNQLFDIKIDRINKPELPLVSGELSINQAWLITLLSFLVSIGIAIYLDPYLFDMISGLLCLLTLYSLPGVRLKGHWFSSLLCISTARSLVLVWGLSAFFKGDYHLSRPVVFFMFFSFVYSLLISIAKDLPDLKGDQAYAIKSLSGLLGEVKVVLICQLLNYSAFALLIYESLCYGELSSQVWTLPIVGSVLLIFYQQKNKLLKKEISLGLFYSNLWRQLFASYLLIICTQLVF